MSEDEAVQFDDPNTVIWRPWSTIDFWCMSWPLVLSFHFTCTPAMYIRSTLYESQK